MYISTCVLWTSTLQMNRDQSLLQAKELDMQIMRIVKTGVQGKHKNSDRKCLVGILPHEKHC